MAQRIFRSDDTSKFTIKYSSGAQGNKVYVASKILDSTDFFYNGAFTGTSAATTGPVTNIPDGVYNLPCKIHQTKGVGSNAAVNYELNFLISVTAGVALLKYPLTKTFNDGAQLITSGNWINVTTNNGVSLTVPAYNSTLKYGGVFFMIGKGKFVQLGTGNVDIRGKGFEKGDWHGNTTDTDYGGYGGFGQAGRSGKGGFSGATANGDVPSGGGRDEGGTGAAGDVNYTGGGGGGGASQAQNDESAGGGGGGGHVFGGGGGGAGTDSNGPGGTGGQADAVGGGHGGSGVNSPGNTGTRGAANTSGAGGAGTGGGGRNGGGGGGGADAACSSTELTAMHLGGAGGGGGNFNGNAGADGAPGSGMALIIFPVITGTGGVLVTGVNGTTSSSRGGGGGGGAAGDVRFVGVKVDIGTLSDATGSSGGTPSNGGDGGYGSVGRIHADYAGTIAGSSNPTLSTRSDKTLVPIPAGAGLLMALR